MSSISYEKANFQDRPATVTPLARRLLEPIDDTIYKIVKYINSSTEYTLSLNQWQASDNVIYPYLYIISAPGIYSDTDHPICQVWGMNEIETNDELEAISHIKKVIVDSSDVKVYADSRPLTDLKLVLKV